MRIRRSTADDAEDISRLTSLLGYQTSGAKVRARLERFAADESHRVFVATEDDVVVGWIHASLRSSVESDTWSEILGFVVDEGARARGVGQALLGAVREWASRQGARRLRVRSKASREDAHGFYRAQGFSFVKTQRVMDLPLTGPEE